MAPKSLPASGCGFSGRLPARRAGRLPAGLTLVEVLFVLVLVALTTTLATIAIRDWSIHSRLDGAAKRVAQALRYAQGQAMVTGDSAGVEFDTDAATLRCVKSVGSPPYADLSDPLTKRPYLIDLDHAGGVMIAAADFGGAGRVTFDQTGKPSDEGTVTLICSGGSRTVSVARVSGAVTIR